MYKFVLFLNTLYLFVLTSVICRISFNLKPSAIAQEQLEKKIEIFRETCKQHARLSTEAPGFTNSPFLQLLI